MTTMAAAPPAICHSLQEITCLSKEGVHYLAINDSQTACNYFRTALIRINQTLGMISNHHDHPSSCGGASEYHSTNLKTTNSSKDLPSPVLLPVPISCMQDDVFYIHSQAIYVDLCSLLRPGQPSCGFTQNEAMMSIHWASMVTLFNLALSYHHHGINHGCQDSLRKSCLLYESCNETVRRAAGAALSMTAAAAAAATTGLSKVMLEKDENVRKMMQIAFVSQNNHAQIRYRYMMGQEQSLSIDLLRQLDASQVVTTSTTSTATTTSASDDQSSSFLLLPFLSQHQVDEILINRYTLLAAANVGFGTGSGHGASGGRLLFSPCAGAA